MSEKMLYILGVATDSASIKSDDKNTQLNTLVETYVGAIEGKSVDSNITVKDPTETWFAELENVYNNGIKKDENLIDFYNGDQLKENTFLLRMEYNSSVNSAENIKIIFFDSDGKKLDPVVIEVQDNTIVIPKKMNITPTKIRDLIELLTTIKIEGSKNDTIQLKSATDARGNTLPLDIVPSAYSNKMNNTPVLPVIPKDASKLKIEGGSSHKTRKGKRNNTKNNKKGGSKTKRKSSKKRVNKK